MHTVFASNSYLGEHFMLTLQVLYCTQF